MTRRRLSVGLTSTVLALSLAGCGGTKPPAASPESPESASAAAPASAAPAAPAPAASASAAPSSDESAPDSDSDADSGPKPSQPPIDLITQTDEAFVINISKSDIGAKIDKACKSDNPAKAAKCKKHKRSKFLADVLQFKKKGDKVTFAIYMRHGKRVTKLSVNEVKLTQKSDTSVAVEITDKNRKPRVLFPHARKFEVTVPNDYSLELKDPKYGKLVYDGKVDILGK